MPAKPQVVFKLPTYGFLSSVLPDPIYARAYVYGRRPQEIRLLDGGRLVRSSAGVPQEARLSR